MTAADLAQPRAHDADDPSAVPAIDSEARLEEIFPNRAGHIGFLILGVILTIAGLVSSGDWRSLIYIPLFIAAIDLVTALIGKVRKRMVRGQRIVIDPERRIVRFHNFRFRRGLFSQREAEREVPFEHLHGSRWLRGRSSRWLLLITSEGDLTIGEWMAEFDDLARTLTRIAGRAPLLSLLRDRCVQLWLAVMLLAVIGMGLPVLLAGS
jgi:hypothetical protein